MLKLTYTETDFKIECLPQSLEEWVQGRVILSLRVGTRLLVEPSTASFLLPTVCSGLHLLEAEMLSGSSHSAIALYVCDAEYVEVCLQGTWIVSDAESVEGVFVIAISERTELLLVKLWQEAQTSASVLRE